MKGNEISDLEILDRVQAQIASFDSKAASFISVIGIVMGLSLSLLEFVNGKIEGTYRTWFYSLYLAFMIVGSAVIMLSVFVIRPRSNSSKRRFVNYYRDLKDMKQEEYKDRKAAFEDDKSGLVFEQISINAKICYRKHVFLCLAMGFAALWLALLLIMIGIIVIPWIAMAPSTANAIQPIFSLASIR